MSRPASSPQPTSDQIRSIEQRFEKARTQGITSGYVLITHICYGVIPNKNVRFSTRGVMFSLSARIALTELADVGFRLLDSDPDDPTKLLHSIDGLLQPDEQANPTLPLDWFRVRHSARSGRSSLSSMKTADAMALRRLPRVRAMKSDDANNVMMSLEPTLPKLPAAELSIGRCVANLTIAILLSAERIAKKSLKRNQIRRIHGRHVVEAMRQSPPQARSCLERLGMWNAIDRFSTDGDSIDIDVTNETPNLIPDDQWIPHCLMTQSERVIPLLDRAAWYVQPKIVDFVLSSILRTVVDGGNKTDATSICSTNIHPLHPPVDLTSTDSSSASSSSSSSSSFSHHHPKPLDQGDAYFTRRYHIHPVAYLGRSVYGALTEPDQFTPNDDVYGDDEMSSGLEPSSLALNMILFDIEDGHGRRWPLMAEYRLEASEDAPCGTHHGAVYHRPSGILIGRIESIGPDEGGLILDQSMASKIFRSFVPHGLGFVDQLPRGQVRPYQDEDGDAHAHADGDAHVDSDANGDGDGVDRQSAVVSDSSSTKSNCKRTATQALEQYAPLTMTAHRDDDATTTTIGTAGYTAGAGTTSSSAGGGGGGSSHMVGSRPTVANSSVSTSSSSSSSSSSFSSSPLWSTISGEIASMCCAALTLTFNVAPERLLTIWSWYHPIALKQRFAREVVRAAFGYVKHHGPITVEAHTAPMRLVPSSSSSSASTSTSTSASQSDSTSASLVEGTATTSVTAADSSTVNVNNSLSISSYSTDSSSVSAISVPSSCPLPIVLIDLIATYYSFDLPYIPLHCGLDTEHIDMTTISIEHHKDPTSDECGRAHPQLNRKLRSYFET